MKILVVGGGSAGLISSLILKTFTNHQVDVVRSKAVDVIGVGEGSTEHFYEFMKLVGISSETIIKETGATLKCGIMFKGWSEKDFLHTVDYEFARTVGEYSNVYGRQIGYESDILFPQIFLDSNIYEHYLNLEEGAPIYQYHFNASMLNDFLVKESKIRGIDIIDDHIQDIVFHEDGSIKNLIGENREYHYDFYIDSTGFKRLLIGKMGAKWQSYGEFLKMKGAVVFQTPDEENYNIWTIGQAMDYGWMFKTPVWGRYGNGYIYDTDYIDADGAKKELDKLFNTDIKIGKEFRFDTGKIDRAWIKNCVAIGLSASFVEPLEASAIGTTIQQAFLLMNKVSNYTEKDIELYNKSVNTILENIRDFIALHYITKKTNTDFWKDLQHIKLPDTLANNLEIWRHRLPVREDFIGNSRYILFKEANFILVMNGLGLFDTNSIRKEFESKSQAIKDDAAGRIRNEMNRYIMTKNLSHKEALAKVKEIA